MCSPLRFAHPLLAVAMLLTACDNSVTDPATASGPVHLEAGAGLAGGAEYCLPNPDRVVSTFAELVEANAQSGPGTRIAIQGMIAMEYGFIMGYDNMVLTCATPGSGLSAVPGSGVWSLIEMKASHDTVSGLVLDARESYPNTIYAVMEPEGGSYAVAPVMQGNVVTCYAGPCLRLAAGNFGEGQGGSIRNNLVTVLATGPDTAIQVQGWAGARVEGNRLVTTGESEHGLYLNGSTRITIVGNQVTGDWIQGVVATDHTTASRLARNVLGGTLDPFAFVDVDSMEVEDNIITCGTRTCGLVHIGPRTTLRRNRATSVGSETGLRIQRWTDGSVIEDNVVVLTAAASPPDAAGIRAHGGVDVRIRGNRVEGPWYSGILVWYLDAPVVEHNVVRGAAAFGALYFGDHGIFKANQLIGGSEAGLGVGFGCYNTFRGNLIRPGPGAPAAVFDEITGANVFEGAGMTVVDNGNHDCDDADGADPNRITGVHVAGGTLSLAREQGGSELSPVFGAR